MQLTIDKRKIGLNFNNSGDAVLWIWAPMASQVSILLTKNNLVLKLNEQDFGYWFWTGNAIVPGDEYAIVLSSQHGDNNLSDGQKNYADPASIFQRQGISGPSTAFDLLSYAWNDGVWKGIKLSNYIIYELHTGTFSPSGDFEGIIQKLDHLVSLGITAIELMPVGQFPGGRNWGYDGVLPFAVQDSYGGPLELMRLVDACHQRGLAVILDVVYNHFGPEGNHFGNFGFYFTDKYQTPWGKAVNFDDAWSDGVREYFLENALMWLRDFHIDALRLDAVHAIKDFSARHILSELKTKVSQLEKLTGREYYLLVELDLNDNKYINPLDEGGYGMDAQWVDEFHHALRVTCGQERQGYYSDFGGIEDLAKSFNDAYVFTGQYSPHRKKRFGIPAGNEGKAFVVFSQNHDQVGNRMLGERSSMLVSFEMLKVMAGAVCCAPFLPMLFMGEEWAAKNPFQFFIAHQDAELIQAVRKGRSAEFADFQGEGEVPDPAAVETFLGSRLDWSKLHSNKGQQMFRYYQQLINLKKRQPALGTVRKDSFAKALNTQQVLILRRKAATQEALCLFNFSKYVQPVDPGTPLSGWELVLNSSSAAYGGPTGSALKSNRPLRLNPESLLIFLK